jgi:hypothetical protein
MEDSMASKKKHLCEHCARLRPLRLHLFELANACDILDNEVTFKNSDQTRSVRTTTIGSWVKIASQLEKVEINSWEFESSPTYCSPIAEQIDSDANHFTSYSTTLTRFIFITNALEETYRFADAHYETMADIQNMPERKRSRSSSLKTAKLIDSIPTHELPIEYSHICKSFTILFKAYQKAFNAHITGIKPDDELNNSYALHLVRNLRNHIAHGIFPLQGNPEYTWQEEISTNTMLLLLNKACRVSALAIQVILERYNQGFLSLEYIYNTSDDDNASAYFLKECTPLYIRNLHIAQRFTLHSFYQFADEEMNQEN